MTLVVGIVVVVWLPAAGIVAAACESLDGHAGSVRAAEVWTRRLHAAGMAGRFTPDPLLDDDAVLVAIAARIVAARLPVPSRSRFLILLATTPIGTDHPRADDQ